MLYHASLPGKAEERVGLQDPGLLAHDQFTPVPIRMTCMAE
jgi:hypothetical protein